MLVTSVPTYMSCSQLAMEPLPCSGPACGLWMLTLGTVWAAESQEQREWELPGPRGPGLRACSCWLCSEQDAVLSACMSVPSFGKGCRAHRDAALSCACQGQVLTLVAELWLPLCCAAEWLLPSLQSQGIPGFHTPPVSQLWAQLCPTFAEGVRDQLWVCSGGSQAHGSPLPLAEGARAVLLPPERTRAARAPAPTRRSRSSACAVIHCCHGNDHTVTC